MTANDQKDAKNPPNTSASSTDASPLSPEAFSPQGGTSAGGPGAESEAPFSAKPGAPQPLSTAPLSTEALSTQPLSAAQFEPLDGNNAIREQRQYWPLMGAAAAVLAILLALLFLLTARSVAIVVAVVNPPSIDIQGFTIGLGSRYLMRPGEYTVTVSAEGYAPYSGQLTVTDDESQQFDIALPMLPGDVSIISQPAGATVLLNGAVLGTTPLLGQQIEAGEQQLALQLPRYQNVTNTVDITGRGLRQSIEVVMPPNWAVISLSTQPAHAELLLNGEPIDPRFLSSDAKDTANRLAADAPPGRDTNRNRAQASDKADGNADSSKATADLSNARRAIQVLAGAAELTITAPGFNAVTRTLDVVAGSDQDLGAIELTPADGVLALDSLPSGANVTVDGEFIGRTPLSLSLTPGVEHLLQLAKPGYRRKSQPISLAQGTSKALKLTLSPELGDIAFSISPADAELVINGDVVGTGSQQLALPAFEHRIEVRKAGYASQRSRVQPRPGLAQVVEITLLTEAEARKAALTPEITSALGQTLILIDPSAEPVNEFDMGASRREPGRRANEVLHTVRLERAYYLASTETSNAQFRQFLSSHNSGQIEGNSLNREHQPVAQVSWQQAARFCNWLSAKEGLPPFYRENQGIVIGYNPSSTGYRLPTEAEWAYASRVDGKNLRRFAWGNEFPPSKPVTNVADNTSAYVTGRILNGYSDGHIVSAPLASFPANHRGLFDMGGNVAEWVHDVYQIPSANAQVEVDPLGPQQGDNYTVRGASWGLSRLSELRLSYRDYGQRGRDDLGFRIARYAE